MRAETLRKQHTTLDPPWGLRPPYCSGDKSTQLPLSSVCSAVSLVSELLPSPFNTDTLPGTHSATPALLSPFPHKIPLSTLHSQYVQCSSMATLWVWHLPHSSAFSPRHHLTRKRCQARSRHQASLDGEGNCFPLVMHMTNSK